MKKRKKIGLIIILIPFLLLSINKIFAVYYDRTYNDIEKGTSSQNYIMQRINTVGDLVYNNTYNYWTKETLDKDGLVEIHDNSKDYNGHIYLDTLTLNFKFGIKEYVSGSVENEDYYYEENYLTINKEGKILSRASADSIASVLKNCILLKDKIPFLKSWEDNSKFIFLKHFSKTGFSPCFIPSMTLGISNTNGVCQTWKGMAYFDLTFKKEKLKFKLPNELRNMIFIDKFDFGDLAYYEIPKKYIPNLDICFLIHQNDIYIIKRKLKLLIKK
jgi:hypothetical protein